MRLARHTHAAPLPIAARTRRPRSARAAAAASTSSLQEQQEQPAVLITGSSSGIGRGAALLLAQRGWAVFAGVRSEPDAAAAAALHPNISPLQLDVTSEASIAAAAQQVAAALSSSGGALRCLVNNAGVGLLGPAEHIPLAAWRGVIEVNLIGALAVTQAFLPLLRDAGPAPSKGRIINVSSVAGHLPLPFWSAYNCSKAGLDALSDCLRYELSDQGIHVALIKPGPVQTPIWDRAKAATQSVRDCLPPHAHELYHRPFDKMLQESMQRGAAGMDVGVVTEAILHAATSDAPKARYHLGPQAALTHWVKRMLPEELWDALLLATLRP